MKILVVEDSSSMRAYLTTIIESGTESYDLEIVEAASGFEALKTLPHHKFDAILTDINMPDINGLELVSFLKNHPVYRSIPIMVISTEVDRGGPPPRRGTGRGGVPGQAVRGRGSGREAAAPAPRGVRRCP